MLEPSKQHAFNFLRAFNRLIFQDSKQKISVHARVQHGQERLFV